MRQVAFVVCPNCGHEMYFSYTNGLWFNLIVTANCTCGECSYTFKPTEDNVIVKDISILDKIAGTYAREPKRVYV